MSSREIYSKILNSGGPVHEADDNHNSLQQQLVAAFYQEHPSAYVGVINRYDKSQKLFYPYNGEKICNFQISFIVPGFDQPLMEMLTKWDGGDRSFNLVGSIYDRVAELGGYNLSFS